ncbi:hypothetical protein [Gracilinema caldarium]|uniref:hypothetical protein n=1 Tax=Gracilinema caldarium TaxID=215591 RepID=UPI0026EBAD15|nr:hypothetical protein [Gracilinema caldarium]
MMNDFIAYKAIDERERSALIYAWVSAAPTLFEYARNAPAYRRFTLLILKVITLNENFEIVQTISPDVYEALIIPTRVREKLYETWKQLYQTLHEKVSEMEDVKHLSSIISYIRVAPQNISGMEA